jgi:hypothetical protein
MAFGADQLDSCIGLNFYSSGFDCHCLYPRPLEMGSGFWSAGNSNGVFHFDVPVGLFSLIVAYRREKKLLNDRAR